MNQALGRISRRWTERVAAPVDVASLAAFRVAFGLLMLYEVWRFFETGWIEAHYRAPDLLCTYPGFDWVRHWPGRGLEIHFAALGVLSLGIATGFAYRLCVSLFTLGFAYVFLLDQARYLNHFYLIVLLAALLAVSPANRAFSVDAWRRPALRRESVPGLALFLLRAQLAIFYAFAAIAKLNPDWLAGWPMRFWLHERAATSAVGFVLDWPPLALGLSWGGLLFDAAIVPALLYRPTRVYAFGAAIVFHVTNAYLFNIGVFPALGIAATTLFLDPSWPRTAWRRVFAPLLARVLPERAPRAIQTRTDCFAAPPSLRARGLARLVRVLAPALVALYLAVQIAVPLRHWLYPTNVRWTEQGQAFPWRVKLTDKTGRCRFWVEDGARDERWIVDPRRHLMSWQYSEFCARPEMLLPFAEYLAEKLREAQPGVRVAVGVDGLVSMNGRAPQRLVDPELDLLGVIARGGFVGGDFVEVEGERLPLSAVAMGFEVSQTGLAARR